MKAKTRRILEDAIERGVARGYRRAFKHTDSPDQESIFTNISDCITLEIDEYFSFGDDE
jgi:hypothetical protein